MQEATETNLLVYACAWVLGEKLGIELMLEKHHRIVAE